MSDTNRRKVGHRQTTTRELKDFLRWWKESIPCIDCGNSYPACAMDCDHIPERGVKIDVVWSFVLSGDRDGLYRELAKCEVVCAVCHRLRTATRGPSSQTMQAMLAANMTPEVKVRRSAGQKSYCSTPHGRTEKKITARKNADTESLKRAAGQSIGSARGLGWTSDAVRKGWETRRKNMKKMETKSV